jgi:hypothetical protein
MRKLPKDFLVQDVRVSVHGEIVITDDGRMVARENDYILESKDGRKLVIPAEHIKEYRKS